MKNDDNETALLLASRFDYSDKVRLLLEHGADPEIKTEHGDSPLKEALTNGNKKIENLLLKHGASPMEHGSGEDGNDEEDEDYIYNH